MTVRLWAFYILIYLRAVSNCIDAKLLKIRDQGSDHRVLKTTLAFPLPKTETAMRFCVSIITDKYKKLSCISSGNWRR